MSLGFSDLPVVNKEDDIFEVSNYVNALSVLLLFKSGINLLTRFGSNHPITPVLNYPIRH